MQIISQQKRSHQESADSSIRKLIYALCKTDNQFNALLVDKFKHLQKDIPESSSLEQKVNILLNIESKHIILNGLRDALEDGLIFPGISDEDYSNIYDAIEQIRALPIRIVSNRARQRSNGSKLLVIVKRAVRRILVTLGVVWLTEKSILVWIWNKIRENIVVSGGVLIITLGAGTSILISIKSGYIDIASSDSHPSQKSVKQKADRQVSICIRTLVITADYKNEPIYRSESISSQARIPLIATLSRVLNRHNLISGSLDGFGIDKNQHIPSTEASFANLESRDKLKYALTECTGNRDGRLPIDVAFSFVKEQQGIVKNCNDGVSCTHSTHYLLSCKFAYTVIDPEHRHECPQPYDIGTSGNIQNIMLPSLDNTPANNEIEEVFSVIESCSGLFNVVAQLAGCQQKKPAS